MRAQQILFAVICVFSLFSCLEQEEEPLFSVQGRISDNGQGVGGVVVTVDGGQSVITDFDGSYLLKNLKARSYIIRPEQAGRIFTPEKLSISLKNQNATTADFFVAPSNEILHRSKIWGLFNGNTYKVKQNNTTTLQLDLAQNALWANGARGGLMYQYINGDFTITSTVSAVSKLNNDERASCDVCLGGLMVRNPSGSGENYVNLATGNTPGGSGYEHMSTTENISTYTSVGDSYTRRDLRIQRQGQDIILSQRITGSSTWKVITTYTRPDFPETLMVGMNIYTASGGEVADLSVIYENVTLE
jgi:hypothetical protein